MQTIINIQILTSLRVLRKAKFLLSTYTICHHKGRVNAPAEQLTSSIKNKNKRAKTELKNVCACVRLTLSGVFQSFDQRKFTPLNNVFIAGYFLAIITFDNLHERMETWLEKANTTL